ncbi:phospholipase D-like domain-containing protein [uncultured Formosa sp.]|uniref:phospholipase D-like domain-containing protein n=1 Tax=uncultured Formosa sp. TaxID=255435 RepID=UPI002624569C|nr:phospholipase D-like domain-containing protein [uncultured Formosa sp.]
MFYNGANCDIYIGKGAGKKLLADIRNARKSIKIVSPYLSPLLITELIKLKKRNLEVELITTDNIEDFNESYKKNIHKLIKQNIETDYIAVKKRQKWKDLTEILTYIELGLLTLLTGIIYYIKDVKVAFGLLPIVIIFLIIKRYKNKIKHIRIYTYWYSQLFPFKVYMSPNKTKLSNTFIHSKIYLIDDKIAYMGSLNFTSSGTKHNYETRIRTEDLNAIKEIKYEIYQLMNHAHLPERDLQRWGKQLYQEPIN